MANLCISIISQQCVSVSFFKQQTWEEPYNTDDMCFGKAGFAIHGDKKNLQKRPSLIGMLEGMRASSRG